MCGQIELVVDELIADGASLPFVDGAEINVAIHIAGWKSILSSPGHKSRKSRK